MTAESLETGGVPKKQESAMRGWRRGLFLLAVLSFVLAGARSSGVVPTGLLAWVLDGWYLRLGTAAFFWIGAGLFLAAAWKRGST